MRVRAADTGADGQNVVGCAAKGIHPHQVGAAGRSGQRFEGAGADRCGQQVTAGIQQGQVQIGGVGIANGQEDPVAAVEENLEVVVGVSRGFGEPFRTRSGCIDIASQGDRIANRLGRQGGVIGPVGLVGVVDITVHINTPGHHHRTPQHNRGQRRRCTATTPAPRQGHTDDRRQKQAQNPGMVSFAAQTRLNAPDHIMASF